MGTARPNFVEKTFTGGSKTVNFSILSRKFSAIRHIHDAMMVIIRRHSMLILIVIKGGWSHCSVLVLVVNLNTATSMFIPVRLTRKNC